MEDKSIIDNIFDKFENSISENPIIGKDLSKSIIDVIKKDKYKKEELETKIKQGEKGENS